MSDIIIFLAYVGLLLGGFMSPFVTSLGYVWVDSFYPQYLSSLLRGFPVSAVMGVGAILAYVVMDRKAAPRVGMVHVLMAAIAIWMSASLTWAVKPEAAWLKWDWAFKAVMFSAFMTFVFRTRVQIEALMQTFLLGAGMHLIGVGIKGMITGGGYQMRMTAIPAELGLVESSAMATVAIMSIPVLLYLRKFSILVPWPLVRNAFYPIYAVFCVTAMVGTGARTGLVCLALLGGLYWLQTKRKVLGGVAIVILGILMLIFAPDRWKSRMETIDDYAQEGSALTRIKVWEWVLGFVRDNPMGGGFRAYEINVIRMPPDAMNPDGWVQFGRAPHSSWFEVLSELGWPGLLMFLGLIVLSFLALWRVWKQTRGIEELAWCRELARTLAMSLLVLMAGSSFIGVAFQPWYWLMFAVIYSLSEHVRRCLAPERKLGVFVPATAPPDPRQALPVGGLTVRRRV